MLRNVGGRVTAPVLEEVAYISYLVETKAPAGSPWFELAVIHHTDCGSGLLADERLRHDFAARTGADQAALARRRAVLDPAETVRADVALLRASEHLSERIRVSGHVYDVKTGLISTIVPAATTEER